MSTLLLRRVPPDLHRLVRVAAATTGVSMQAWMLAALRAAVLRQAAEAGGEPVRAALEPER